MSDWSRYGRAAMVLGLALGVVGESAGQVGSGAAAAPDTDKVRVEAEMLVGKALFLRGFYMANDLRFDVGGRVVGAPKTGEWTLAAVNVLKVQQRPGEIDLDGVRAAIRYNAEQHQFERHALIDEKMKIVVAETDAKGFEAAVEAIFAVGIDLPLQRSMPDYWQHYFNPALEWPADQLNGVTIYPSYGVPGSMQGAAKDVIPAKAEHKVEVKFTSFAEHDRVRGALQVRMVVDAEGVPRRISIAQPLGYGLEERAVEAMAKWRFAPATLEGKPVATVMVVAQDFEYVAPMR